ncbi:MAG: hypothetical protein P1V20_03630 [Verrucomicrobiales bacterium]|nr:hypothetical protein [Verrucomicrobiales bacterium]
MKHLSIAIFVAAIAVSSFHSVKADDHKNHSAEAHAVHLLGGYFGVSDALYKSDLDAAKTAASAIITHDKNSALAVAASAVVEADDLAVARESFKKLSARAIQLAEQNAKGKFIVMHCPMVKGGSGDWLSSDGKVNNPYFGSKMPHCGGPKN